MARRPGLGREIRAKVNVDLSQFKKDLERLSVAVQKRVTRKALEAGGEVVRVSAQAKAPGPGIGVQVVSGAQLKKGRATFAMKGDIGKDAQFAIIGPTKEKWYYRFREYGTKAHGVKKRKLTRTQQSMRRARVSAANIRKHDGNQKPAMSWLDKNGKRVFSRQVAGIDRRPFMEPAITSGGARAVAEVGRVLAREIEKECKA